MSLGFLLQSKRGNCPNLSLSKLKKGRYLSHHYKIMVYRVLLWIRHDTFKSNVNHVNSWFNFIILRTVFRRRTLWKSIILRKCWLCTIYKVLLDILIIFVLFTENLILTCGLLIRTFTWTYSFNQVHINIKQFFHSLININYIWGLTFISKYYFLESQYIPDLVDPLVLVAPGHISDWNPYFSLS